MTKMLVAVIALSVLGFLAYRAMYGRGTQTVDGEEVPTQRLQNVQDKAKQMEKRDEDRAADIDKKTQE